MLTRRASRLWHNWVLLTWGHYGKNQSEQMKNFDLVMSSFLCFLHISRIFVLTIICRVPIPTEPLGPRTPSCTLTWSCWGRHTWTRCQHSPPAPCPSSFSYLHPAAAQRGPGNAGEFAPLVTALCQCSQVSLGKCLSLLCFGGTTLRWK